MIPSNTNESAILRLLDKLGLSLDASRFNLRVIVGQSESETTVRMEERSLAADRRIADLRDLGILLLSKEANGKTAVYGLDPTLASRALYSRHLWSVCPDDSAVSQLPENRIQDLREYGELCREFESSLKALYTPPPGGEGIVLIHGDTMSAALATAIQSAKRLIRGITAPSWCPRIELVWEAIKEKLASGVSYRRIADEATLIAFGYRINQRDVLKIGVELRIVPRTRIKEKFFIIDNTSSFIFWPAKPGLDFPLEASATDMGMIVRNCEADFEHMWQLGVPATDLFPFLGDLRESFVASCSACSDSKRMTELAQGLFDYGHFFFDDCSQKEIDAFGADVMVLKAHGLVIKSPDNFPAPIPNIFSAVRKRLKTTVSSSDRRANG